MAVQYLTLGSLHFQSRLCNYMYMYIHTLF